MNWKIIREEYEQSNITLKELAAKYGVSEGTMRSRKNREKWQRNATDNATQRDTKKKSVATQKRSKKSTSKLRLVKDKKNIEIDESLELTEKQRLFCLYFIKNHNATMAAIKAGYAKESAHVQGHENLRKPKIAKEIRRLKGRALEELFIDAMDVLEVYAKIAFADIGDYVNFGRREVQVMGMYGPVFAGEGKKKKPVMQTVNFIDLKEKDEVDSTIISEVKEGRDGVSIKLLDKMKALEKLEKYLDILPDHHKRKIDDEKLKLEQAKFDIDKAKVTGSSGIEANNERILTLANLLNNPVPNRNVEDFEEDDEPGGDNPS